MMRINGWLQGTCIHHLFIDYQSISSNSEDKENSPRMSEGLCFSRTITFMPFRVHSIAQDKPANPQPTTMISKGDPTVARVSIAGIELEE